MIEKGQYKNKQIYSLKTSLKILHIISLYVNLSFQRMFTDIFLLEIKKIIKRIIAA